VKNPFKGIIARAIETLYACEEALRVISQYEQPEKDYIDMEEEGHFTLEKDEIGYFQFGLVQGRIDYRIEKVGGIERLEFSWEGQDENDEALGRGWAVIKNDHIEGRFYFHLGDNSFFKAEKLK